MWKAVHPSLVGDVRVPDVEGAPTFVIGFFPPFQAARLAPAIRVLLDKVRGAIDGAPVDYTEADHKTACEVIRWGVRGWSGFVSEEVGDIAAVTEQVQIDGRPHTALAAESIEVISVNRLALDLALECVGFNNLRADQKKRSASRSASPSLNPATSAANAIPYSTPTTTAPSPSSSTTAPGITSPAQST